MNPDFTHQARLKDFKRLISRATERSSIKLSSSPNQPPHHQQPHQQPHLQLQQPLSPLLNISPVLNQGGGPDSDSSRPAANQMADSKHKPSIWWDSNHQYNNHPSQHPASPPQTPISSSQYPIIHHHHHSPPPPHHHLSSSFLPSFNSSAVPPNPSLFSYSFPRSSQSSSIHHHHQASVTSLYPTTTPPTFDRSYPRSNPNPHPTHPLFDHRHPYLHSDQPFHLDNSPELHLSNALIFPCAQQESDPEFSLFPKGLELIDSSKEKMPNSTKASTASNHNLVGHRIDHGRLEFMSVLGLGAYGVVYLARDLTSPDIDHPKLYAVKALNKIGLDARQKSFQRREIALHSLASSHPSIVTLHAVIESPSCIFVILDYCPDGDLFGMITEKQRYLGKTDAIKNVFIQIIDAVQFCHRLGISHRDLKPENILCKKQGDDVVLADFGLATAEKTSSDFGCGSTFYMSPECQGGLFERLGAYSTLHNDIWSLGVILVNLTCGRNPWKQACPSDETFRAYLANPDFLRSILPISEACNSLLKRIFSLNPVARISLEELKLEIIEIKNFNMTTAELSRATRATREAARTWRKDIAPSPKISQVVEPSSWKNVLAKKTKQPVLPQPKLAEVCSTKNFAGIRADVVKRPLQYESCSSSSTKFTHASSLGSFHHPSQDLGSPMPGLHLASQKKGPTARPTAELVPTGPLVSAFTSTSISKNSSVSSSEEHPKRPRGFSSRLRKLSNAASPFSQSSKDENRSPSHRKKLFTKPLSFNRPNAPCPIVVKPYGSSSASNPQLSPTSGGLITPTNKKGKHSTLTFLPSTPPPSVSPSNPSFGFIKKPSRFFLPSNHHHHHQTLPPTPSTPNHPSSSSHHHHHHPSFSSTSSNSDLSDFDLDTPPSSCPDKKNRILPRSPLASVHPTQKNKKKKIFDQHKFDLFSSSSSSSDDDHHSKDGNRSLLVDNDFDVDDDDDPSSSSFDTSSPTTTTTTTATSSKTHLDQNLLRASGPHPHPSSSTTTTNDYHSTFVSYSQWLSKKDT